MIYALQLLRNIAQYFLDIIFVILLDVYVRRYDI